MIDAERFWAKVNKTDGCWEWTASLDRGGYGHFGLNGKVIMPHRYSYIIHHPLTTDLWEHREICVCHKCDNPRCVNPAHMFLGSQVDNIKDRDTKGRGNQPKGERQYNSKLTETQVREIRGKFANGELQTQIALEYGTTQANISSIIKRKSWKHI